MYKGFLSSQYIHLIKISIWLRMWLVVDFSFESNTIDFTSSFRESMTGNSTRWLLISCYYMKMLSQQKCIRFYIIYSRSKICKIKIRLLMAYLKHRSIYSVRNSIDLSDLQLMRNSLCRKLKRLCIFHCNIAFYFRNFNKLLNYS
jgi:hypothetical protein